MGNETHRGKAVQGYGAHTWAMGHMGDVAQGTMGYRGMGCRRYGLQGVCGTWAMGHISNGGIGAMGYRVCGVQGVWSRWAMEYMCNGHNGLQGYGVQGGMGHMGNEAHRGYGAHGY